MEQQAVVSQYFATQPVKRAYLFGSYARGEATSVSDVDILVELEASVTLFDFARMQMMLEDLLRMPVDLVSANGLPARIRPFIDTDKVLIYEKTD